MLAVNFIIRTLATMCSDFFINAWIVRELYEAENFFFIRKLSWLFFQTMTRSCLQSHLKRRMDMWDFWGLRVNMKLRYGFNIFKKITHKFLINYFSSKYIFRWQLWALESHGEVETWIFVAVATKLICLKKLSSHIRMTKIELWYLLIGEN